MTGAEVSNFPGSASSGTFSASVSESKESGFDFLAVVIFHNDFNVKSSVVAPCDSVWELVASHQYNRLSYLQACGLPGAIDVTDRVRDAGRW